MRTGSSYRIPMMMAPWLYALQAPSMDQPYHQALISMMQTLPFSLAVLAIQAPILTLRWMRFPIVRATIIFEYIQKSLLKKSP